MNYLKMEQDIDLDKLRRKIKFFQLLYFTWCFMYFEKLVGKEKMHQF